MGILYIKIKNSNVHILREEKDEFKVHKEMHLDVLQDFEANQFNSFKYTKKKNQSPSFGSITSCYI